MSLKVYRKKRNFKKTQEPYGRARKKTTSKRVKSARKKSRKKLTYLIQKHAASHLHYDFRLELNGDLKSWAVPKGPSLDPSVKRLAVHVEDHPLDYGSFEGIIPKGEYGGGTVMLWDTGYWKPHAEDVNAAYEKGDLTFELDGERLKGFWKLIRLRNDPKNWLLMKITDEYAKQNYDITEKQTTSVVTGRSMEEITEDS